jgi:hypothetical protein
MLIPNVDRARERDVHLYTQRSVQGLRVGAWEHCITAVSSRCARAYVGGRTACTAAVSSRCARAYVGGHSSGQLAQGVHAHECAQAVTNSRLNVGMVCSRSQSAFHTWHSASFNAMSTDELV